MLLLVLSVLGATSPSTVPSSGLAVPTGTPSLYAAGVVIPGLERMSCGVDITKLELFPSKLTQDYGLRKPVLGYKYANGATWTNPSNNIEYLQPDDVSFVHSNPGGVFKATSEVAGDTETYKGTMDRKIGGALDTVKYGKYSGSVGYKDVQDSVFKLDQTVAETSITASAIEVALREAQYLNLDEDFESWLEDDLTRPYEAIPEKYEKFVDSYGTHYFESGFLGGYLLLKSILTNTYVTQTDDLARNADLEAAFFQKVSITANVNKTDKKVSKLFSDNCHAEIYFYGGLPVKLSPNDTSFMKTWLPTIVIDPWILEGRLTPLEELIQNKTVKAEVTKAILIRRAKAYLEEVRRSADLSHFPLTQWDREDLVEIDRKLSSKEEKDVAELASKIEQIFDKIQHLKDKQLLATAYQRSRNLLRFVGCFAELKDCVTEAKRKELAQIDSAVSYFEIDLDRMAKDEFSWTHQEARRVLEKSAQMIHHHRTQVLEPCASNGACQACLKKVKQERFVPSNYACSDPILDKLIKP